MPDTPVFVTKLKAALEKDLRALGLKSTVSVEPAGTTKLYRFFVVSDDFRDLRHSERQNIVWRIVDKTLSAEDSIKVSMIMTLAKEELGPDIRPDIARKVNAELAKGRTGRGPRPDIAKKVEAELVEGKKSRRRA
jgi:hypothetical protein